MGVIDTENRLVTARCGEGWGAGEMNEGDQRYTFS